MSQSAAGSSANKDMPLGRPGRPDQRASKQFLIAFTQFWPRAQSDEPPAWNSGASPWYPYLERQFAAGVSAAKKARLTAAAGARDCDRVLYLELQGFVGHYPHLRGIFDDDRVHVYFETVILPNHSFAYRRYRALTEIHRYIAKIQRLFVNYPEDHWRELLDVLMLQGNCVDQASLKTGQPINSSRSWLAMSMSWFSMT